MEGLGLAGTADRPQCGETRNKADSQERKWRERKDDATKHQLPHVGDWTEKPRLCKKQYAYEKDASYDGYEASDRLTRRCQTLARAA